MNTLRHNLKNFDVIEPILILIASIGFLTTTTLGFALLLQNIGTGQFFEISVLALPLAAYAMQEVGARTLDGKEKATRVNEVFRKIATWLVILVLSLQLVRTIMGYAN